MKGKESKIAAFIESISDVNDLETSQSTLLTFDLNMVGGDSSNDGACINGTIGCSYSVNGGPCQNTFRMCENSTNRAGCDNRVPPVPINSTLEGC
ncbi:MAG: hypothetical protein K2M41_01130 [Muribaculaceae bacterium]|nr:hypothetical protein [Muribaculaceae bacterium]